MTAGFSRDGILNGDGVRNVARQQTATIMVGRMLLLFVQATPHRYNSQYL
jgi:hypothetical protein